MNRSYSKIRHIQESNLILENRIINEEERNHIRGLYESTEEQFDSILSNVGITLTPEEKEELSPDCLIEDIPEEYNDIIEKVSSNLDTMDVNELNKVLQQVISIKKQPIKEQAAAIMIAGVAVPMVMVVAVASILILIILIKLSKLLFRGSKQRPSCRKRHRLIRRFGVEGYFR